jgi:hypothetical protein
VQAVRRPVVERRVGRDRQRYARDRHGGSCRRRRISGNARVVVFEILKASGRKAAQVIIFKDTQMIFIPPVYNFVRKWGLLADDYRPSMRRAWAPHAMRRKMLTLFNELPNHSQCNSVHPSGTGAAHPWCA